MRGFHFWRQESRLFTHAPIWLLIGAIWETATFEFIILFIYLFFNPHNIHIYHHHHHHVVPLARISLTLSRYFSLSFIASSWSSRLHPVSSHSCCVYVLAGRPAFARPYVGIHRSASLMSSSLLLQLCPACLVRLTCIVFVMGARWPYSCCLVYIYIYIYIGIHS